MLPSASQGITVLNASTGVIVLTESHVTSLLESALMVNVQKVGLEGIVNKVHVVSFNKSVKKSLCLFFSQ